MQSDGDESWLSGWEQQCIDAVENEADYELTLSSESDYAHSNIWGAFQESATAVAHLYRDRQTGDAGSLWVPFQTAAGTVTALYKASCEGLRRTNELAMQSGYQRRNRDLLSWARKRRRTIRREDLLAYLAGKPPPPRAATHRSSPRPRTISPSPDVLMPVSCAPIAAVAMPPVPPLVDSELHTFREALAMSTLGRRSRATPELYAFVTGEIARHCKRPGSPSDVNMESPTHHGKRQRFM